MAGIFIITNNDAVVNFFKQYQHPGAPKVDFIDAAVLRVFQAAKAAAQNGAELLTNPITIEDPKCENPFKTLVMTTPEIEGLIYFDSMTQLDFGARAYQKAAKNRFRAYLDDNLREFKTMDLQLLMSCLQEIVRSMMNNE